MTDQMYNPEPEVKIDILEYKHLVDYTLNEQFSNYTYDPSNAGQKARDCCAMLQNKVYAGQNTDVRLPHRYKLVFQCYINETAGQGIRLATRSMWDSNTDNLISQVYRGKDYVATLFLWYCYQE